MTSPRIAVYSPNGSISHRDSSHRAAWPKLFLRSLEIKDYSLQPTNHLSLYDEVWLYLGMEWTGSLNLFGGASTENAGRLLKILEAKTLRYLALSPAEKTCPLLGSIAKERSKGATKEWLEASWGLLDDACMMATPLGQKTQENCVVGDSHALSLYDGKSIIYRHDHKTLHGALAEGLASFFPSYDYIFKRVTFCFGNIDLQHHLARLGATATIELAQRYVRQAAETKAQRMELMELLPVFGESRKLSTTGYYKGNPWGGTWEQRDTLRALFNRHLRKTALEEHPHVKIVSWPSYVYNPDGSFNQAYMEAPRGVHLSWEHRRETWPL